MDGISAADQAPGSAQVAMLRKVLDSGSERMTQLLDVLPKPAPVQARPGEWLL